MAKEANGLWQGGSVPIHPDLDPTAVPGEIDRRKFVKRGRQALAAGLTWSAADPRTSAGNAPEAAPGRRPNFVILITDQERFPQHWPEGWAERNLPNRRRLAEHGLTFTRAFCASSMCSPSRASLLTGLYPARHGVTETLQTGDLKYASQHTLAPEMQNIAHMLASAGYDVQYRGKWHISKDPSGTMDIQSRRDMARYGFQGWQPPDAGQDHHASHFGGGDSSYDELYARQAADFLRGVSPRSPRPFALVVALVNPHDLMGYPKTWNQPSYSDIAPYRGSDNYGRKAPEFVNLQMPLPSTFNEPLAANFKPTVQAQSNAYWGNDQVLGALDPQKGDPQQYVNFYAYLHTLSDGHIGALLDAMEDNWPAHRNTIVIRLADHGEMGLAHGGMRQKAYNAYEETIHVPLVFSNPALFRGPVRTPALASLVDLMPTLATLARVPDPGQYNFQGRDLSVIIQDAIENPRNPTASVQDSVLFTTDETLGSAANIIQPPFHIRCLREGRWKVVLYFDPAGKKESQYELYDLEKDPEEYFNLGHADHPALYRPDKLKEMLQKLQQKMKETGTDPRLYAEAMPELQTMP